MGLDMYAFITRTPVSPVDFKAPEDSQEIAYWCKHPDLHGWMAGRYFEKGGNDPLFNCNTLRLDADDLDALEKAVNENSLPHTTGFFFGDSDPERIDEDREFILRAREALAAGYLVFYDSWW